MIHADAHDPRFRHRLRSLAKPSVAAATALVLAMTSLAATANADAEIGKPAPPFTLMGSDGQQHSLTSEKGKIVVLEWLNHGCPYVRAHYSTGNMQALQKELTAKGVVWLSIISSAPGKQGYVTPEQAAADAKETGSHATAILLDPTGKVGHRYGAKTTPHMFVIDASGKLVYKGAIDDHPTFSTDGLTDAKNYVRQAVGEVMAGKPVSVAVTNSYGCSIKYE
jgi:peroxiredoxin